MHQTLLGHFKAHNIMLQLYSPTLDNDYVAPEDTNSAQSDCKTGAII